MKQYKEKKNMYRFSVGQTVAVPSKGVEKGKIVAVDVRNDKCYYEVEFMANGRRGSLIFIPEENIKSR